MEGKRDGGQEKDGAGHSTFEASSEGVSGHNVFNDSLKIEENTPTPPAAPGVPPDGGAVAWLQVAAGLHLLK